MITSSTDILIFVIAFCLLWLTFFVSWGLYYMIMIMRDVYGMIGEMKRKLESINIFFTTLTERLEHTSSALQLFMQGFSQVTDYLQERKSKKRRKSED